MSFSQHGVTLSGDKAPTLIKLREMPYGSYAQVMEGQCAGKIVHRPSKWTIHIATGEQHVERVDSGEAMLPLRSFGNVLVRLLDDGEVITIVVKNSGRAPHDHHAEGYYLRKVHYGNQRQSIDDLITMVLEAKYDGARRLASVLKETLAEGL